MGRAVEWQSLAGGHMRWPGLGAVLVVCVCVCACVRVCLCVCA